MDRRAHHRLYPKAPVGVKEGDIVWFFARRRWYDFLLKSKRNRPFKLGSAKVTMVDPVMKQVWYDRELPQLKVGDYMMVESWPS